MYTAAVANSNYQKTNKITWSSVLEDLYPSLAMSLRNFPLCLFYAFTPSALTEVWTRTGTVQQQMSEALRCSQGVPRQQSDSQALTSSPPGSAVLISAH